MTGTDPLESVSKWGWVATAAWLSPTTQGSTGPVDRPFPWASVTKVVTALAVWVAVEEGTVAWEDPAGPPGATLAHLLSHASGIAPDRDEVLAPPGRRRIYSNRGIELAAAHVAQASGIAFADYAAEAVTEPLGMAATSLDGSPASGGRGPLGDLVRLAAELLRPSLVSTETHARATAVCYPGLAGVLPGFGRQDPNDWGLGVEVKGTKSPHWTGTSNSPKTYGHFGQSGSFLWVDPEAQVALVSLSERPFGPLAAAAWPTLADQVLADRA